MQSRQFLDALQIARCAPHPVTIGRQQLCSGEPDAGTRTGDKNFLHDVEKGCAPGGLRVATALLRILTIGSMQECPE